MLWKHQNLTIRDATVADAATLCGWWNDGRIMVHVGYPEGMNINEAKVRQALMADTDGTHHQLILEVDAMPVDEIHYRDKGNDTVDIGIKIGALDHQGRGYGTLFLKMFISGLFANGYEKITLDTSLANTRAQHVYEKLGFQRQRVNINSWTDQLGVPQSSVDYQLLRSEHVPYEY